MILSIEQKILSVEQKILSIEQKDFAIKDHTSYNDLLLIDDLFLNVFFFFFLTSNCNNS